MRFDYVFLVEDIKHLLAHNPSIREKTQTALYVVSTILWKVLLIVSRAFKAFKWIFRAPFTRWTTDKSFKDPITTSGYGKTVLVTTGRQAKTLHTVRALKEVGARVIVSDYDEISASHVSVDCDLFIKLPALPGKQNLAISTDKWIENFYNVLVDNNVDIVLPVSTINEVLIIGLAKHRISKKLPNLQWISPDLQEAITLDDRASFAKLCENFDVPCPKSGVLESPESIPIIASRFVDGIMLKRIESSINRSEEIVHLRNGSKVPQFVRPSTEDPWQWQEYIHGNEASVWYVVLNGEITCQGCYKSEADLTKFDATEVPHELDIALRRLIKSLSLSGQFAFDFFISKNGKTYVIECNPRSSSVLETISSTPFWGACFFGHNMCEKLVHDQVGFLYHENSWPFTSRREGYISLRDPFPFFVAEFLWPMHAIATKGLTKNMFVKIDVNICKIIIPGPSPARNINFFKDAMTSNIA